MIWERANRLGHGVPTVILGAGQVGHLVARRLLTHPELGLRPIGFVDADPLEVETPSGLPVLGSHDDLEDVVRALIARPVVPGTRSVGHGHPSACAR